MAKESLHKRQTHLLGTKLRSLRKRNGLTLEELSARCIQLDRARAPSVSYLSMIETGKRIPSQDLIELLAELFQRDPDWFLDGNPDAPAPEPADSGAPESIPLEPAFLFSRRLLQAAVPELLSQTGTTGRQFAHLLIRAHQEASHNDFPDLERAAEAVGQRQFPLQITDLEDLYRRHGLELRWFDRQPMLTGEDGKEIRSMVRSFFDEPGTVYVNRALESEPARLKYDLASHLGHKLLHDGDGLRSTHATGGPIGGGPQDGSTPDSGPGMSPTDVLHAWRDFECSFFAGALLCPRQPFRRFLTRESYRVEAGEKMELTDSVMMRRMTSVSPYPHWHFFDAYGPGYLRSVYRGNGIPLPWGNMAPVTDACPNWAVFRALGSSGARSSQLSVLIHANRALLYCCHSIWSRDLAGNPHVLSVGIDMLPALHSHTDDPQALVNDITARCQKGHGEAPISKTAAKAIRGAARVLNIAWVEDALREPARIICSRGSGCPRESRCAGTRSAAMVNLTTVREQIIAGATR